MPDYAIPLLMALFGFLGGILALSVWHLLGSLSSLIERPKLPPETQAAIKGDITTVQAWVNWNPWYLQDEALRLEAQSIHLARQKTHPGEPLDENLTEVAAEMRRRYSDIPPTLN